MEKHAPLLINLKPSPVLAVVLALAHGAALVLLALLPLPVIALTAAALPIIASACWAIGRQALRRGRHALNVLEFSDRETLRVRSGDGIWHGGSLLGSSTVGAALTVLNVRLESGATRHVVITADGIDADDFRRLRVWLRWGPGPAGDGRSP